MAGAERMRGRGREGRGGVAWRAGRASRGGGWSTGSGRCGSEVDWTLFVGAWVVSGDDDRS